MKSAPNQTKPIKNGNDYTAVETDLRNDIFLGSNLRTVRRGCFSLVFFSVLLWSLLYLLYKYIFE